MDQIALPEGTIYPRSIVEHDGATYFLCKLEADGTRRLGVIGSTANLPALLDQFDTRQVLHVCFGTLLDIHGAALRDLIAAHEGDYRAGLERHFTRHLGPFV